MTKRPFKQYALYKGDQLLKIGTSKELAEFQGISEMTLYHYTSPAYRKRVLESKNPETRIIAIRLDPIYAMYKGDKLLKTGTLKQLAEFHGSTESGIHYYTTPEYRKTVLETEKPEEQLIVIQLEPEIN